MNKVREAPLNKSTVEKLIDAMSKNPYAVFFRTLMNRDLNTHVLTIRTDVNVDQSVYNRPTSDQVVVVWIEGKNPSAPFERDIIVQGTIGHMYTVKHYYGCYDPLQYPLFFPFSEVGWHQNISKKKQPTNYLNKQDTNNSSRTRKFVDAEDIFRSEQTGVQANPKCKVSCREYYCYKLQEKI